MSDPVSEASSSEPPMTRTSHGNPPYPPVNQMKNLMLEDQPAKHPSRRWRGPRWSNAPPLTWGSIKRACTQAQGFVPPGEAHNPAMLLAYLLAVISTNSSLEPSSEA